MRTENVFVENNRYGITVVDLTSSREGELLFRDVVRNGIRYTYIGEIDGLKFSSPPDNILIVFVVDGSREFIPLLTFTRRRFRKRVIAVVEWTAKFNLGDVYNDLGVIRVSRRTASDVSEVLLKLFEEEIERRNLQHSNGNSRVKPSREVDIVELANRIDVAANAISDLRLNSTSHITEELKEVSASLRSKSGPDQAWDITRGRSHAKNFLYVVAQLYDHIENSRMASIIVCGAVTAILGCTGWSATFSLGLTLAAWQGKDAFVAAISKLPGPKSIS